MKRVVRFLLGAALVPLALAWGADSDGDGIPDGVEESLGTYPDQAEAFTMVLEDAPADAAVKAKEGYDGALDVERVWAAHAGGDRFVWRVDMASEVHLEDTVLHLYVDADLDADTGRKSGGPVGGVEYMLSAVGGNGRSTVFAPDGGPRDPINVTVEPVGKSVFLSADIDLQRTDNSARCALYVLCHSMTREGESSPRMSDSTTRKTIAIAPLTQREEIRRLVDLTESENTERTFGLDVIRATLRRDDVIRMKYDDLELDGFEVDVQTSRRFGHVVRREPMGSVSCAAAAGTFHVGFLMYDDGYDERVAFQVDGTLRGVAVADSNNYRHWIYWLSDPIRFTGGERVSLLGIGPSGKHGISSVLFMPTPPPISRFPYTVNHVATFTPVGEDGRALISWTTGMPSVTRLDYGPTPEYGSMAQADDSTLAHRVDLKGLDPDATYHGQAIGLRPDGSTYTSDTFTFRARAAEPPASRADTASVPLRVRNPHSRSAAHWPVTGGVPFPQGELATADDVALSTDGEEVPLQAKTTARWPDGSVKWLLLSFLADVPAEDEQEYILRYGRQVDRAALEDTLIREQNDGLALQVGQETVRIDAQGRLVLPGDRVCLTAVVPADGAAYAQDGEVTTVIEEDGPVRGVVKVVTRLSAPGGDAAVRVEKRIECFRAQPFVRVWHTVVIEAGASFGEYESMTYSIPADASQSWLIPVDEGESLSLAPGGSLLQRFDRDVLAGDQALTTRITGAAVGPGITVAVRDFWQNYPKGFRLDDQGLQVGLCPDFEAGLYDTFPFEKEGHQLYFYLLNGRYKLKRGMAKTHELMLDLRPGSDPASRAQFFQRPLLAVPPPEWMCATNAFYAVAPRNTERFEAYEEAIDANVERYARQRETQHDFGMMNYGDWYGERGANWGNIEYDTQHAFILEFIRSGNEDAFFLADQTERHNRDVDTIHWSPDPSMIGAVYIHQMGHVGGYYTESVPGTLGIPRAGYSVSHAWAEGHFNHYFLTGDRRSYDTGRAVVDYFARKTLSRPYDFTSCRVPGWHLMMNAIAYASTSDPYYLNVSRVIVDRVLETQDKEPRPLPEYQQAPGRTAQVGGWTRMMVPGHCHCIPRHRGNAGFMVAVLLSGLKYYHDVTGDPEVKDAIIAGARYLVDDCYSHEVHGFRYTSCPKTGYRPGCSPLMAEGIARAYMWTRDPLFEDVLTMALPVGAGGSGYGKSFSMYYRVAPRVLADLATVDLSLKEQKTLPREPFVAPDWMEKDGVVVIEAEDFADEGQGTCQKREDRQAVSGQIVTYWHQDIGHWLEWRFEVPETAEYAIRLRYASGSEDPRRRLVIDGELPFPEAEIIRFETTGGFGTSASHWAWRELKDDNGSERTLRLEAGAHVLRMTNLNDGLALDMIALVPAT